MNDGETNPTREIFLRARELPPGERTAFIEGACRDDAELLLGVARMLAADDHPPAVSGLTSLEVLPSTVAGGAEDCFPKIDGYQFLGRLGHGAMGVVWKAVQLSTRRPVALKLLKAASFGSARARLRFEREVELTAKLDHPHIARVFDSGEHHGVFYYVMQLIRGDPLDRYAAAHKLSRAQIIELMELICRAVQHAHQKGVIHRDLKHSNIMVDEKGEPHVLDFGLAKATDGSEFHSLDGEVAGTPPFMSPEQAAGKVDRLDTRSDVYTLGVILFHLLSGKFPHDVTGSSLEVMRRISELEPKRLGDIQPHPDRELQALLSKSLEKDPNRRYASAGEMADDLRRYLNHDPLVAQPPTLAYLLSKKLRRYRVPLAAAAVVVLLLGCVMVAAYARVLDERNAAVAARIETESQRQAADRQRREAERQRGEADRQRQLAVKALSALKETAPTFYANSQALVKDRNFAEALKNASYAADLVPEDPTYQLARANLLQSLYRFEEAAAAYEAVLALRPDDAVAKENVDLCRQLALEQKDNRGLKLATLSAWQAAMQQQRRFAEAMVLLVRINETDRKRQDQIAPYQKLLADAGSSASVGITEEGLLSLLNFNGGQHDLLMLRGIPLESASFNGAKIDDLTPLSGMPLKRLFISHTGISDLRPLSGMPLVELNCHNTKKVNDLRPLSGMPLASLDVGGTSVSDLTPLRGAPLADLNLYFTPVKDLLPLRGAPLKRLILLDCGNMNDIAPLRGMPLEELDLGQTQVRELGPLRGMKLRSLNLAFCPVSDISVVAGMPLTSLFLARASVTNIGPLRGLPLKCLSIDHNELQPADVLHELPMLERIDIEDAEVGDLETLRTVPITEIRLGGNLADVSPLHGKTLESLALACGKLTDLTPLEGIGLKNLSLQGCISLRDLRPLLNCPQLERLSIPSQCRDIECLRQLHSLKYLVYDYPIDNLMSGRSTTADEFWKQYDARKALTK